MRRASHPQVIAEVPARRRNPTVCYFSPRREEGRGGGSNWRGRQLSKVFEAQNIRIGKEFQKGASSSLNSVLIPSLSCLVQFRRVGSRKIASSLQRNRKNRERCVCAFHSATSGLAFVTFGTNTCENVHQHEVREGGILTPCSKLDPRGGCLGGVLFGEVICPL